MEEKEKIITVTGKGNIHVVPDVIRIDLLLVSLHDTYQEAYAQGKDNTEKLTAIMKELGLPKTLPKTIRFDIEKQTQTEYDKYHNYKGEKFLGFQLDHRVKIDISIDTVLLNNIVKLIGRELKQAEINIGYTVKDQRPAELKMLQRAVKDAKEKASIMAEACGCKLGPVKSMDYSEQEIHIFSQARQIRSSEEAICCEPESLDITPDDLSVSDSVTVVWYINNDEKE